MSDRFSKTKGTFKCKRKIRKQNKNDIRRKTVNKPQQSKLKTEQHEPHQKQELSQMLWTSKQILLSSNPLVSLIR